MDNLKLAALGKLELPKEIALKSVTGGIKRNANLVKNALRRQIRRAGLGEKVEKTVQVLMYPEKGLSYNPTAELRSKFTVKKGRPGGRANVLEVFDQNTTIHAAGGKWLAIPTDLVARDGRGSKRTPEYYQGELHARRTRNPGLMVLADKDGRAFFFLVKKVFIKDRLSIMPAIEKGIKDQEKHINNIADKLLERHGFK